MYPMFERFSGIGIAVNPTADKSLVSRYSTKRACSANGTISNAERKLPCASSEVRKVFFTFFHHSSFLLSLFFISFSPNLIFFNSFIFYSILLPFSFFFFPSFLFSSSTLSFVSFLLPSFQLSLLFLCPFLLIPFMFQSFQNWFVISSLFCLFSFSMFICYFTLSKIFIFDN